MKLTYFRSMNQLRQEDIQLTVDPIIIPGSTDFVQLRSQAQGNVAKIPLDAEQVIALRDSLTELIGDLKLEEKPQFGTQFVTITVDIVAPYGFFEGVRRFYKENAVDFVHNVLEGGTFTVNNVDGYHRYTHEFLHSPKGKVPEMVKLLQSYLSKQSPEDYRLRVFSDDELLSTTGTFHQYEKPVKEDGKHAFAVGFLGNYQMIKSFKRYLRLSGAEYLIEMFDDALLISPTALNSQSYFGHFYLTRNQLRQAKLAIRLFVNQAPQDQFLIKAIQYDGLTVSYGELNDPDHPQDEFYGNMQILWDAHI